MREEQASNVAKGSHFIHTDTIITSIPLSIGKIGHPQKKKNCLNCMTNLAINGPSSAIVWESAGTSTCT